jgi:hypothetical protein
LRPGEAGQAQACPTWNDARRRNKASSGRVGRGSEIFFAFLWFVRGFEPFPLKKPQLGQGAIPIALGGLLAAEDLLERVRAGGVLLEDTAERRLDLPEPDFSPACYRSAPFIRAYVPGVPREEPVMTFKVLHSVLTFAISGLVQFLNDLGACRFSSLEVRINIVDEYCKALSLMPDLRGAGAPRSRAIEHYPGIAEMHLRAIDSPAMFAITVVLGEIEYSRQPNQRLGNILIRDMRQYDIRWH